LLIETGLEFDRAWMVVDEVGEMLTQRELPRMALIRPTLRSNDMVLRAPGMLALHIALDTVEEPTRVRVWDDTVSAYYDGLAGLPVVQRFPRPEESAPGALRPRAETPLQPALDGQHRCRETPSPTASRCSWPAPPRWPT
jgi:hypothetical protein